MKQTLRFFLFLEISEIDQVVEIEELKVMFANDFKNVKCICSVLCLM